MQEDEILNCPDCQLQALQQHQNQLPTNNHQHMLNNSNQQLKDHLQQYQQSRGYDMHNQTEPNDPRPNSDEVLVSYQGKNQMTSNIISSYKNSNNSLQSSQCASVQNLPISVTGPSLLLSSSSTTNSSSNNMLPSSNPCLTSVPIEGCDVSGYCATCAVLDLPSNDKFYRSSISGHSVFPTMFYRQPPPIPGFSPLPDCGPWSNCNSNDFGSYTYPTYAQQSSSGDYYGTCSAAPSSQGTSENTNQVNTLSSCSFSFANSSMGNDSQCMKKDNEHTSHSKGFISESANDEDDSVIPICISSSSEDTSDSESFISQHEVIVEDVDEDDASVSISVCNIDKNQKCAICQNLIMADCPSPLVNIFENIHEDITAEDLDITVSSGDIEIGGIEDEVRDFHTKKSLPNGPQITFGRLSYLLTIPVTVFRTVFELEDNNEEIVDVESQSAPLCSKCGKLAASIDSLEKQFRNNCMTLKQYFHQQTTLTTNKPLQTSDSAQNQSVEAQTNLYPLSCEQNNCSDDPQKFSSSFASCSFPSVISKQTQTDPQVECSKECLLPFEAISRNFRASKLTSTKDTMTDYDDTLTANTSSYSDGTSSGHLATTQLLRDSNSPNNAMIFNDLNLTYDRISSESIALEASNQENFRADSPMGNLNLGSDIHDFTCSFIPEINKEKDLPEIFGSCNSSDDSSSSISLSYVQDTHPNNKSKFLCEECGKILGCRKTFDNHLKRHHNDFVQKCQVCFKGFANEATLALHIRTHTGEKPFQCPQCNKSFAAKSNLISHEETCKLQAPVREVSVDCKLPLSDSTCNKNASPENKLLCVKCGICFRLKARLEQHELKGCKAKALECSQCSKKFSKRSEMKIHLLMHDGLKPYFCNICGISFSTKGNQIAHTRTHWVEKRFKCDLCDKGFHRKQALQLHYNRHNGLKPYSCNVCERKFFDPSNLQNHKKVHHKRST